MSFTKRLFFVLLSVWSFSFLVSMGTGFSQGSGEMETQPTFESKLPPFVTLTPSVEKTLEKFPGSLEQIQLAVKLVRDQLYHLHTGNFEEASSDWHNNGEVLHLRSQIISARRQPMNWSPEDPITVSAGDYIDALKKNRVTINKKDGTKMLPPKLMEGVWRTPFGGLEVTVLHCGTSGVLISVDNPENIDLGEPSDMPLVGRVLGYRHVMFMIQMGLIVYDETDPTTGLAKSEWIGRIHHLSLEPNSGC